MALERSFFVNHLLNKMIMEGITALSTTPSIKRMIISSVMLLTNPVAAAKHTPQYQRPENKLLCAFIRRIVCAWNLEKEIAEEKKRTQ